MSYKHSSAHVARDVLRLMLWVTRRLLRVLFRRPLFDVLLLLVVLYLIASLIGSVNQPQPLRTLEEISADILAIEQEAEGLLDDLLKVSK